MGQPLSIPPGFQSLSVKQKLEYVQALWKQIGDPQDVPSPEWHREIVRQRLAEHRANPEAAIPWDQVRAELMARFGRRG
jgi:putative addiction module component (TIGR02574 family)